MASGTDLGESFESVLLAAQAGDEWAFSRLYHDMNPRLLRYFGSRAPQEAEDLSIETWLGAARRISEFRGDHHQFRAWMFVIAHGRLVQHWRDAHRRSLVEDASADLSNVADPDNVETGVLDGLTGLEATREIVKALSFDQAEVILLRVLGGFSVDEVARICGKRAGTVRVLQHKALRRLSSSSPVLAAVNATASVRD